jgi:hypothetical protein
MNEYPCIDCGSNVRPRQEALQCDQCSQWQHRLCNTGKTFLFNCIAFVYYLTPQIINHTCDRVAMLQLEIWSHNWRFFIDVFDACFYCLLMFSFCLFQVNTGHIVKPPVWDGHCCHNLYTDTRSFCSLNLKLE